MPEFTGSPDGEGRRFAVLVSRFNEHITQKLADGAMDALVRHGCAVDFRPFRVKNTDGSASGGNVVRHSFGHHAAR